MFASASIDTGQSKFVVEEAILCWRPDDEYGKKKKDNGQYLRKIGLTTHID
jgi:hypothetical protein